MGKPGRSHVLSPTPEHIGCAEGTWGSETSHYPQEEKATAIPLVVASERGSGQTRFVSKPAGVAERGLWEPSVGSADPTESDKVRH
jgi:hypothetical protein